jgi:TPR repeat protein
LEKKGVTEEDRPEAVVVLKDAKETDEALNNVPSPAPVPPPVITLQPPAVAQAPVSPEASPSPGSPLDPVFDFLNRLPQPPPPGPPPGSPPDVATTSDQPEAPPASATNEPAKPAEPAPTFGEIQAAEAKALLETGYKAYQNGHYTRAFRMFREAAQKGNSQAQYETAEMLIEGQGVEMGCPQLLSRTGSGGHPPKGAQGNARERD